MSLAQDIRNAYDARDRDALEWALSRIPNVAIINSGPLPPVAPPADCVKTDGCACAAAGHHGGGCLWRSSTIGPDGH